MSSWLDLNTNMSCILDCKLCGCVSLPLHSVPFSTMLNSVQIHIRVKIWQKTLILLWEKFCVLWAVPHLAFCTPVSSTNLSGGCVLPPVRSTRTLCTYQADMHAQPFLSIKSGIIATSKFISASHTLSAM